MAVVIFSFVLLLAFAGSARGQTSCCFADLIFIIDQTDGLGFGNSYDSNLNDFLDSVFDGAIEIDCDSIQAAIIEYGSVAKLVFDFDDHPLNQLRKAFDAYDFKGPSLGKISNAKAGFEMALQLTTDPKYGHKSGHPLFIFWLTHSIPDNVDGLIDYVNASIKPLVKVAVVSIGDLTQYDLVKPAATKKQYARLQESLVQLIGICSRCIFDYCPPKHAVTTTLPNPTNPPFDPNVYCFQCRSRRNNKDLYPDPNDCHFYYACFYPNDTSAIGFRRPCPAHTFWHDEILQCMPEGEVTCEDPCRDDVTHAIGSYAGVGCRQYFVCANTASYSMCCPDGTFFNATSLHCEPNETCNDSCSQISWSTTEKPATKLSDNTCRDAFGVLIANVPRTPNAYILFDNDGTPTITQYCPDALDFNLITCRCDIDSGSSTPFTPFRHIRRAILWLPFNGDSNDHAHLKIATFLYDGAEVDTTVHAQGNGSLATKGGSLELPGLKTYDLRANASWCAFFRCESGPGFTCTSNGGILSNNRDATSTEFTIILSALAGNKVQAVLNLWHPSNVVTVSSTINTPTNGFNHVCVTYNGNEVDLFLNGALVDSESVGGYLSIAHCPYVIGNDQQLGEFIGHIDDVLITPFAMTKEEMDAHRNGSYAYLSSLGLFS